MWQWDFEKLSMKDVLILSTSENDAKTLFAMIDKALIGGADIVPATKIKEATQEFLEKFGEAVNPK